MRKEAHPLIALEIRINFTIQLPVQDFLIYPLKNTFHYQAGTFEEYWSDYLSSTAKANRLQLKVNEAKNVCYSRNIMV